MSAERYVDWRADKQEAISLRDRLAQHVTRDRLPWLVGIKPMQRGYEIYVVHR